MAYVEVPDSDLDADSPWQQSVVQQMNDNIKSNKASEVTGGDTHDHAGGDGNPIITASLANDAVTDAKLARIREHQITAPYAGTTINENTGLTYTANSIGTGAVTNGTDTSDVWMLARADNNTDYAYILIQYVNSPFTVTESGHETIYKTLIKTDTSISDIRLWYGFSSDQNAATIRGDSTPDVHGSLFRYATDEDGTAFWRAVTIGGTWATDSEVTITTTAIATSTEYELEIRMTATEHTFYINSTLVATHNTVGDVPDSTTGLYIHNGVTSLSGTGSARGFRWNNTRLIKEV